MKKKGMHSRWSVLFWTSMLLLVLRFIMRGSVLRYWTVIFEEL